MRSVMHNVKVNTPDTIGKESKMKHRINRRHEVNRAKGALMSVMLVAAMLTGCGSSASSGSQGSTQGTSDQSQTSSGILLVSDGTGVSGTAADVTNASETAESEELDTTYADYAFSGTQIELSDSGIKVDGSDISTDSSAAVYTGADIVYYKEGQDDVYGVGDASDEHSEDEAAKNTVVTITKAGTYIVSGTLSAGQIAIDLGEDASKDTSAVVNLVLDNADITCTVAPAIIAYNVYECGSDDEDTASKDVDTTAAGFNLVIADGTDNNVSGSHVAAIYKEGTTQEEIDNDTAKKAHKYDAAIESLMSFNIKGDTGKLTVNADNEGIETKLHLTIDGGDIVVNSNDDSVNAGEDGVSVITINGGTLTCDSDTGDGNEGDGIDSNGWIVMNGGTVTASANSSSPDSGVDSDEGIYINGGTLLASGNMYDEISTDSSQKYMVLSFNDKVSAGQVIVLCDKDGNAISAFSAVNDFTTMIYSSSDLADGDYTVYTASEVTGDKSGNIWSDITSFDKTSQMQYTTSSVGGAGGPMTGGSAPADGDAPAGGDAPADAEKPAAQADASKSDNSTGAGTSSDSKTVAGAADAGKSSDSTKTVDPSTTFTLSEDCCTFGGIEKAK